MKHSFKRYGFITDNKQFLKIDTLVDLAIKSASENSEIVDEKEIYNSGLEVQRPYNLSMLAMLIEKSNVHRRCCDIKSGDIAGNGWTLSPYSKKAKPTQKKNTEKFIESISEDICKTFKEAEFDFQSFGELYIEIIREGKNPTASISGINHIPTLGMYLLIGKNVALQIIGAKRRYYKAFGYEFDIDKDTGNKYPLGSLAPEKRANEFIYDKIYNLKDSYYGMPYVLNVVDAIVGDLYARKYNNSFFQNYGMPAGLISVSGDFNKEIVDDAIDAQMEQLIKNPQSIVYLSVPSEGDNKIEVKFERISDEAKDSSFQEFCKQNKQEIADCHGVPLYLLGDNSESTGALGGSNSEQAIKIYKRTVVEKRQAVLESIVNRLIQENFKGTEIEWQFKFNDIDEEDKDNRLKRFILIMEHGGATIGDLIKNFGEEFGLETTDEDVMNTRFIGQQVLLDDLSLGVIEEATDVMKSFKGLLP